MVQLRTSTAGRYSEYFLLVALQIVDSTILRHYEIFLIPIFLVDTMAPNAPLPTQQSLASKVRVAWQSNSRWDSIISVFVLVIVLILLVISARYRSHIDPLRISLGCIALGILFLLPIALRVISRLYIRQQTLPKQNQDLQGLIHNYQRVVIPHNRLNTLLIAAMISFALPALHLSMWAPGLKIQKIETAVDKTVCREY